MRSVSLNTYYKYRKYARKDNNISDNLLKIRLNCMIDATEKKNIHPRLECTMYRFGDCMIYVCGNIIRDIRWSDLSKSISNKEKNNLKKMYKKYGLNIKGKLIEK